MAASTAPGPKITHTAVEDQTGLSHAALCEAPALSGTRRCKEYAAAAAAKAGPGSGVVGVGVVLVALLAAAAVRRGSGALRCCRLCSRRSCRAELEKKSFTNGKDDTPLVKRLYEAAFEEQFGKATELIYNGLGWGDAEAAQLAKESSTL
ncbi:hypothetical protein EMIHUDRAFT_229279 [Emiliania huxleyi CCMP1516]|uniref:Uncharacterized protein n=2 Tax=Emiliania huxleyi TaxID=2903 RepID=A0A0D3KDE0_EMIH1|nr:hypothetical protein EMIHUDRAFT_229279 [Emiliania huxleyi CCMP1516]EOD33775.1 hypothetical protein EMIHUDRAFT_229279 [Emiliania huxleyi CCMP1516]|eukprot:XP_005786204.1 hypothetical protein EMIHUDRAFT_229279 [Emiliania huxleyi CCMP1516]